MQALRGTENSLPLVGGRSDGQMDCLSLLFCHFESAREKLLLLEAEELIMSQFVLTSAGALQVSKVQHHDILFVRVNTVENGAEIVKRVVVADHHQDISRPNAQSLRREIVTGFQIELIEFRVF